ncbi:MAG: type I-C CRISPR-associated protein Cas7/Csd2, partial [Eubacterium sp.]
MSDFTNKIDFAVVLTVEKANPNGDPLNGNRPRENYDGFGEISDVCIKRKIRNRLQDMGNEIFVQSDERCLDGYKSLSDRAKGYEPLQKALKAKDKEAYAKAACEKWIDVRTFGQVFAFKDDSVSIGVRGPVSIHPAVSQSTVDIYTMQITKSVNSETKDKKSSDTMGAKHRIDFGVYLIKGSINHQLAEKTGFSDGDTEKIKEALRTLFENDSSSARPDGSMEVKNVYWWKH